MGLYDRDYMRDDYLDGDYGYAATPIESSSSPHRSRNTTAFRRSRRNQKRRLGIVSLLNLAMVIFGVICIAYWVYSVLPQQIVSKPDLTERLSGTWKLDVVGSIDQRRIFVDQMLHNAGGNPRDIGEAIMHEWTRQMLLGLIDMNLDELKNCWEIELTLQQNGQFKFRESNLLAKNIRIEGSWTRDNLKQDLIVLKVGNSQLFGQFGGDRLLLFAKQKELYIPVCILRKPIGWIW